MGYDVHRLTEDRKLIMGGVEIPYEKGLLGHSDADVVVHAIMDALLGAAGTSDAAIIDSLMAAAMVGEGTGYEDLTYTIGLSTEEYGVGFRKDSDAQVALDEFFAASYKDGSLMECAEKYGVQAAMIAQ